MVRADILDQLVRFELGDTSADDFESWLYSNPDLDSALGEPRYVDLLSLDLRSTRNQADARRAVRDVIESLIPGRLNRVRATVILRNMLDAPEGLLLVGLRRLVALRHQGADFIPDIFLGLDSETDSVPGPQQFALWSPEALDQAMAPLRAHATEIRREALLLLEELEREPLGQAV